MAIDKLNAMVDSDEFKSATPDLQKQALRGFFKTNVSSTEEFVNASEADRNQAYNGFLKTYMPKEEKGFVRRVVDGVTAPFKAVASAYAKDQEAKPTTPITATEKLELARPLFEMGRRSEGYMKKLERDAELEQGQIKRDEQEKKRTAQIEESKKPALQQLADQFNPMRPITAIPAMVGSLVGGEETGKAIAKEFGGDYQYSSGERDTTFAEANPEYVMAESIIVDPLNTIGAPVKATAEAVKVATKNPLHNAAEEIIQSTTKNLGIDPPKPAVSATPDDEVIAKAIADEYGVPKAKEENPLADSAPANDIDVAPKTDVGDTNVVDIQQTPIAEDPKLIAQAEQAERVRIANEEAMARKAALEEEQASALKAQEEADALYQSDIESIQNHPRFNELIESRRNVSAREAQSPNVRESDRQIIHENNGDGYETSVIPATDTRNYAYDFATTKADIAAYEKNGMSPELVEKFKRDLEVYDNDPLYAIKEPAGRVDGDKYIDEAGNEIDIPFSKGESIADVHTLESMQQSVRDAIGEEIDTRLSPIMGMITKADIPEAVLKEAGDSAEGIHGFIHEGKAYIVADNIPKEWSASQIRGLVMHEVGVHLRKAGSGDKDFGRIIEAMRGSDDPLIKEAYARVPQTTAAHRVDEEALAYLIQTHPDTTIARRVIAWVKQQLIRLSISPMRLKMTPQDLSAMAWGAVKRDVRAIDNPDIRLSMEMEKRYMEKGKLTKQIQKDAVELPPALSRGQFYKQYGTSGWVNIDTPVGKMRFNVKEAYNHIAGQNSYYADRLNISGAFHTLFTDPLIVAYNPMKKQTEYFTPFKDNDEVIHLLGVAKDDKGNMVLKTFFDITDKTGDIERIVRSTEGNAKYFKYSSSVTSKGDEAGDAAGQILKKSSDKEIVQQPKDESQEVQFSRVQEEPQPTPEPAQSAGGFYSVAQKAIETMPNKMNVSAFRNYLKGKGVKNDEMVYGGIEKAIEGKETITKAEMLEALKNPQMSTKVLDEPKYQMYSNNGIGDNYREELTKLPKDYADSNELKALNNRIEQIAERRKELQEIAGGNNKEIPDEYKPEWKDLWVEHEALIKQKSQIGGYKNSGYSSGHWSDPNVLYHVRKQDTTLDGEKTLLIEEIQSDWHQDGRKMGYKDDVVFTPDDQKEMQRIEAQFDAKDRQFKLLSKKYGFDNEDVQRINQERMELNRQWELYDDKRLASIAKDKVPQAPYAKNWHEKALKDQIDEAVSKGYDRVAWVDGKTSADRYSLSKSVDRLVYNKDVGIIAGYKNGEEVIYKTATDGELTAIIGKDPAKKLMDNEVHPGVYEIKGEALDIGGDGMRGFYDKILPDYARKYVKKWEAEVEKKTLSDGTEVWSFPVTKEMSEDVTLNGQPLYAHGMGAVAGIETDEDGNIVGFNPLMALAGAAVGSMVVSKSVRSAVAKVAARAEKLSDAAARNLIIATVKGADKITAGTITKTVDKIVSSDMADYVIGHKIYRMKDYMKMREEALRSANAGMESAARLHLQLTEFSSEAREAMYEYMSGNKEVILTPELKRAADTFVEKIDGMGKTMVDEGFLSKEAYEEWKGQYLHRRYASKMKQASDWASGKGEFAVDKIQMRGKTWNASEEEYQELLKAGQIGKVSEGKIEVLKDSEGTYKLRRDWTREERSAMGEIRDVAYSLPETIGRMAQMIEFGKMLKAVPSKYILAQEGRADNVMKQLGYEKLSGSRYGALNGKWVNQSIAGDLKRVSNDVMGEEGNVKRMWSDYVSAMKMSHTVYNPTAHVNNVGSNVFLQTAAGLNPVLTIKYATDGARAARKFGIYKELDAKRITGLSDADMNILSKLEADEDVKLWRELNDKHMFGRSQLNEMLRTYMSPHVDTAAGSAVHKVSEGAKALYQAEDDVMRFSAIKQLTRDGMWDDSGDGLVKRKMEIDEAMTHVNDTIVPDYTKPMSKLALTLRDSGIVPFMSWTYYSTPILIKQLRDHPTRVMAIAAAWYGLDRLFGVDPYDDESMPKGFAEQRVAVGRDGDKVTGFRVSSMIPHIQLANPANTFLEPLTSGIPQTMLGEATNYNFYFRKPITTKEGGEGAYHRVKDAVQNALPSPDVFDKAYNLAESKLLDKETRRRDRVFEPRTPAQEAASFFVNLQTYDMSNNKERMRKDKITSGRNEKKWDKKTDDAMRKMERIFQ